MKSPNPLRSGLATLAGIFYCLGGSVSAHVFNNDITTTGVAENGSFHRYGWIDGTNATLGDSHHLAEGNFFTFHLSQASFVDIGFAEISGNKGAVLTNGLLDPAFSLYSGVLPDLAHDDTSYDPLAGNTVDKAPAGHVYLPHDGYRDTAAQTYTGQFDALGTGGDAGWSMANEDAVPGEPGSIPGNWAKIKYITHVNANVTALGATLMPSGAVNDAPESLTHYPLPAGDYTIAASGASCDNLKFASCTNPNLWGRVTFSAIPNVTPSFVGGGTALTVVQGTPANLKPNLTVSDTDTGQTETWSQASAPAHGALSFAGATALSGGVGIAPGGAIAYTPAANYAGADSFAVKVDDGLSSAIRSFTVTVKANTPPTYTGTVTALKLARNFGSNLKPLLTVSDTDAGQTETWSQNTAPQHGSLTFANAKANSGGTSLGPAGSVIYQPTQNYTGSDSFAIKVSDGVATTTRTYTVTVGTNTAPVFVGTVTALKLVKDTASGLKSYLPVSDTDHGQTETWSQQTAPANGKLTFTNATAGSGSASIAPGGSVAYTPNAGFTGNDGFTVKVGDGIATATRQFTVSVQANIAPAFLGSASLTVAQGSAGVDLKPNLHVNDTNHSQTETWSQQTAPGHGTLNIANATAASGAADITPGGTITYTPAAGYVGQDSFAIKVSDGVATTIRTFTVTVAANKPPAFTGGTTSLSLAKNWTSNLKPNLLVSDTDTFQTETWSQATAPAHGTLSFTGATAKSGSASIASGGGITYVPAANYVGPDSFAVRVGDGVASATRTFTVSVGDNVPPSFVGTTTNLYIAQNGPAANLRLVIPVSDTNHGQTETWSQQTAPAHGALGFASASSDSGATWLSPSNVSYTPTPGYSGPDSFTLKVGDGVATATRTYNVTVGPNTVPSFLAGTTTLNLAKNGAAVNLKPNLRASDTDTGQTLTWSAVAAPANGALVVTGTVTFGGGNVQPAGTITYQPKANWTGTETFQIKVNDNLGATATRTFTVNVQ